MSRAWISLVLACALLAALAAAAAGGWHARAVIAERDALSELNRAQQRALDATRAANAASVRYIDARDSLAPVIRMVRVLSDPVIRVLDSCALPVDAGELLDRAADAADCRGSDCAAVPARTAPERAGKADGGRSVPAGT